MKQIFGKYANAIVFTNNIEESCVQQVQSMCDCFVFSDCKIRIMPDCHSGKGAVIGFTSSLPKDNMIIPNIVGVDINCGMLASQLVNAEIDYARLDKIARQQVPVGAGGVRKDISNLVEKEMQEEMYDICAKLGLETAEYHLKQLGSLGGGNHFISIEEGIKGKYLIVHSGSRNFGVQVAQYFQNKAVQYCEEKGYDLSKEFCFIQGKDTEDYLQLMAFCDKYARKNREIMAYEILSNYGIDAVDAFTTTHNYINLQDNIIRKGAISCHKDEKVLIPINMAYGSFIVNGKGNDDWNNSAPHGAGRVLSRSAAHKQLSLEEFKSKMQGIYSSSVSEFTLDESPMAYKNGDEIKDLIQATGVIVDHLIPKFNLKAND